MRLEKKKKISGTSSASGQTVKQVNVFKGSSRRLGLLAADATELQLAAEGRACPSRGRSQTARPCSALSLGSPSPLLAGQLRNKQQRQPRETARSFWMGSLLSSEVGMLH